MDYGIIVTITWGTEKSIQFRSTPCTLWPVCRAEKKYGTVGMGTHWPNNSPQSIDSSQEEKNAIVRVGLIE